MSYPNDLAKAYGVGAQLNTTNNTPQPKLTREQEYQQAYGNLPQASNLNPVFDALTGIGDVLSRGQYASAGFFDSLINDNSSILDALSLAGSELVSPTKRKSFTDVISKYSPDFATNNPMSTRILGFLGDVALDPTTYIGFGLGAASKGARIGGKALSSLGEATQLAARSGLSKLGTLEDVSRVVGGRVFEAVGKVEDAYKGVDGVIPFVDRQVNTLKNVLGGKLPNGVSEQGLKDLIENVGFENLLGFGGEPGKNLVRTAGTFSNSADELISRIANLSPDVSKELFKLSGLNLEIGVPFVKGLQTSVPLINKQILNTVGLGKIDGMVNALKALPGIKQAVNLGKAARGSIDRYYDLPEEYIKIVDGVANDLNAIKVSTVQHAQEMSRELTKEGRERVTQAMNAFDSGITSLLDSNLNNLNSPINLGVDGINTFLETRAPEVMGMVLKQIKLQPKEQAALVGLINDYAKLGRLENEVGIVGQGIVNIDPKIYDAIGGNVDEAIDWINRTKRTADGDMIDVNNLSLDSATRSKIEGIIDAKLNSNSDIKKDAVLLYAARTIKAQKKQSTDLAEGALLNLYPEALTWKTVAKDGLTELTPVLDKSKLPKRVAKDWQYFGEFNIPQFLNEDTANAALKFFDKLQSMWKVTKTVINPSFGARQGVQNLLQSSISSGNNIFRAIDPRASMLASQIVLSTNKNGLREAITNAGVPFIENWSRKYGQARPEIMAIENSFKNNLIDNNIKLFDFADGSEITTSLNQKYTRDVIEELAKTHGVLRGTAGYSGELLNRTLESELGLGASTKLSDKVKDGMKAFWQGYKGITSKVEDTSRLTLFINGLQMGDSPVQAAQRVNKALFDYQRNATRFETEVLKRLIPFYSFTRQAIPFALKQSMENPSAPGTMNKIGQLVGDLFSVDDNGNPTTLTPEQRRLFGKNYIVDHPRIYKGMDKDGNAVFNTFNNISPYDVLTLLTAVEKNGEVDVRRTFEKQLIGIVTPFLKMPVELLANKNFFTSQVIDNAKKQGTVWNVGKAEAINNILPEPIKELLGWEWVTDPKTGNNKAYVNPYLAYTSSQITPTFLRNVVQELKPNESVFEKAYNILIGVGKEETIDFKKQKTIENIERKNDLKELRDKMFSARRLGQKNTYAQALDDYRKLLRETSAVRTEPQQL
jgi:hypothetical protein